MIVEGHCRKCGAFFDAHWHWWDQKSCPSCGVLNQNGVIWISTDEDNQYEKDELGISQEN